MVEGERGERAVMRLALIFDKTRPDTTGVYFERACQTLGLTADQFWLRDADRIPATYDCYLRIDHGDDYLIRLPSRLRPTVFYAIDTHMPHSWPKIRHAAGWYDLVFCCHRDASERLPGAQWLPLACDLELHGASANAPRQRDLAFVGNDGGVPRKFILQALRERYPNSYIGAADYRTLGGIYGSARIGFNYSIANDVNMRVFEVLAGGALLVTNALRGDEFERLGLRDRQHLVLYRNAGELVEVLEHFLAHPAERETIARAGADVVRQRHTYAHRIQALLHGLSQQLGLTTPGSSHQEPLSCESS